MLIRSAYPNEFQSVTQLMRQSKAFWGYSAALIEEWHDELSVSSDYISRHNVNLALEKTVLCGMCGFRLEKDWVQVDSLFISPGAIGSGVGSLLLNACVDAAKRAGKSKITLDADPNAEGFYAHHGFITIDNKPSSIKGRFLPVMCKTLSL